MSRRHWRKLSLDALIQRDVPEEVRTSAFARSETLLQMAWVVGGAIGIALPLNGMLGMSVAATLVAAGVVLPCAGCSPRHGRRAGAGAGGVTHRARRTPRRETAGPPDSLRP